MAEEYVIIRVRRAPRRRRRGPVFGPADVQPDIESLDVNVVTSRQAVAEAHADPDVRASARSMPMQLIAPVAINAVALDEPTAAPTANVAWGVRAVGADTSPFDGTGVVVAVLDTGIDRTHPAFKGIELVEKDFTGDGDGDVKGHGTHCAGTIFGRDVDGMRIGIARGVTRALIGKVIGRAGGSSAKIASAIHWAIENNANVISMSLGIDFPGYQAELESGLFPAAGNH
jgi:subtilisin family serine protease